MALWTLIENAGFSPSEAIARMTDPNLLETADRVTSPRMSRR